MAQKKTAHKNAQTSASRRKRRTTEEVIDSILQVASELFEKNGYERTTTAEIARKANVAEPLIFKHFQSKKKLFHDAIFKPLDKHFETFSENHLVAPEDTETRDIYSRQYTAEVQQFIVKHSNMLKSLIATQMYGPTNVHSVEQVDGLNDYFEHVTERALERLGPNPKIHPRMIARISFAAQLSCVLFKDWLFPKNLATDKEINNAIVNFIMEGIAANEKTDRKETNKS